MDWTEWKAYWWDVIAASFNWAVNIWPIPTVLFGVVIVAITTVVFWKLGRNDEAKNIAVGFFVSLVVSIVLFILFVILIGPFLHSEGMKANLSELEALRIEKKKFDPTLEEVKAQRDDAIKQQKLFEEARDILQLELDTTRKQLDAKKASMAEKARRKAVREQLGRLLAEGEILKRQCLLQIDKPPPMAEAEEWFQRIKQYVEKEFGSADALALILPPIEVQPSFAVPAAHNRLAQGLERRLVVLRSLIKQLNPGIQDSQ